MLVPLAGFLLTNTRDNYLFCCIWLLKPLRGSIFFRLVGRVLSNEARNLLGVAAVFGILLFGASLAGYLLERNVQPESFGSIPKAMWWAVVTLTTTGYGDEIPHATAVLIEQFREGGKRDTIRAVLFVERDGQKGILIGQKGRSLKELRDRAVAGIEKFLGRPVELELWIKVRANWRKDPKSLAEFGYL